MEKAKAEGKSRKKIVEEVRKECGDAAADGVDRHTISNQKDGMRKNANSAKEALKKNKVILVGTCKNTDCGDERLLQWDGQSLITASRASDGGGENGDPRHNKTRCSCSKEKHRDYTLKKKPTEQWENCNDLRGAKWVDDRWEDIYYFE